MLVKKLMEYLRSRRCLFGLDNVDAILSSAASTSLHSTSAGQYREGYEGYGLSVTGIVGTPYWATEISSGVLPFILKELCSLLAVPTQL